MNKRFRVCGLDQPFLLPPSLQDWLPEDHLARFIADVTNELDLSAIYAQYERQDGRGLSAYHPLLLTRLLLYGYCVGVTSSRRIERATHDDVAFRYLAANQRPDHDTIAAFRRQHLDALAGLFVQALRLCQKAGLVKLGNVAIDGAKIMANASTRRSVSYERLTEREQYWEETVARLLAEAEHAGLRPNQGGAPNSQIQIKRPEHGDLRMEAHLRDPQPAEALPPPHRTDGSSSTPFRSCRGSRARIAHLRALLRSNPGRRRRRGAALPTIPNSRSRSTLQNSPPVPSHSEIALCAQIPGNFLSDRLSG